MRRKEGKEERKHLALRKGRWWFHRMISGKRTWVNLETDELKEARRKRDVLLSLPRFHAGDLFSTMAEKFLREQSEKGSYTRDTKESRGYILGALGRFLGEDATVTRISRSDLEQWLTSLRKTLKPSTVESYCGAARSFFRWARDRERLRADFPAEVLPVGTLGTARAVEEALERDSVRSLLKASGKDPRLRFVLLCGFHLGFRKQEIIEARVEWFDFRRGVAHIHDTPTFSPKDRDRRFVPMNPVCRRWMRLYLKVRKRGEHVLMPEIRVRTKARYRWDFRRPFDDLCREAGVPCHPHLMRHTFASILLEDDATSFFKVAEWLGDDVRVVQRRYAHVRKTDQAVKVLARRRSR
jgi:integrase